MYPTEMQISSALLQLMRRPLQSKTSKETPWLCHDPRSFPFRHKSRTRQPAPPFVIFAKFSYDLCEVVPIALFVRQVILIHENAFLSVWYRLCLSGKDREEICCCLRTLKCFGVFPVSAWHVLLRFAALGSFCMRHILFPFQGYLWCFAKAFS